MCLSRMDFINKVHAAVNQMSLYPNAFEFWKAVKSQQEAVGSLFQPVTGTIPMNFNKLSKSQPQTSMEFSSPQV